MYLEALTMESARKDTVLSLALLITILLLCATAASVSSQDSETPHIRIIQLPDAIKEQEIRRGDILNIMLWENERIYINAHIEVNQDGKLTLPDDRTLQVADKTVREFTTDLRNIYQDKYPHARLLVTLPRKVKLEDVGDKDFDITDTAIFKKKLRPDDTLAIKCWKDDQTYFDFIVQVSDEGDIALPLLGTIRVTQWTPGELRDYLARRYVLHHPGSSFEVQLLERDTKRPIREPKEDEEEIHYPPEIEASTFFTELPLFGEAFFDEDEIEQRPSRYPERERKLETEREEGTLINIPVPSDYTLGPGDEIAIRAWTGAVEHFADTFTVSQEGIVYIELLGEVSVAGLTLADVRENLRERFNHFYEETKITATLARIRAMDIYVTGDVRRPGRYTLSGTATAFSALYQARGISDSGSLRNIALMRKGEPPREVDLYSYLLEGDASGDVALQSGDTILVQPRHATVGIAGQVKREAKYEIRGTTTLNEAIDMAGGLDFNAYAPNIEIWRVSDRARREVLNIDIARRGDTFEVQDGDLIIARPVVEKPANTVELLGAVKRPGTYEVQTGGLDVAALIEKAEGVADTAYIKEGAVWRLNENNNYEIQTFNVKRALAGQPQDNLSLQSDDKVYIYHKSEVLQPQEVSVSGAIGAPGTFPWVEGMTVSDLLLQAKGPLPDAYMQQAELFRTGEDMRRRLVAVNLAAIFQGDGDSNVTLQPGDHLKVYMEEERIAEKTISVGGFVNETGTFKYHPGMHASDAIHTAGGLKPDAGQGVIHSKGRGMDHTATQKLELTKTESGFELTPDPVLGEFDHVAVLGAGDMIVEPRVVEIEGRVKNPGAYTLQPGTGGLDTLYDVLQEAGPLLDNANPYGIVVYRAPEELLGEVQRSDVEEIFDTFNRQKERGPQKPEMFTEDQKAQALSGQIGQQLSQIFGSGDAVAIVTPPRELDNKKWAKAVPVDGHKLLDSRGKEENFELHHGDVVVVPEKVNTVAVLGAVVRPGSLRFRPEMNHRQYIELAGGAAEDAALDRAVVIRANGHTVLAPKTESVRAGDIVLVPSKYLVQTISKDKTWTKVLQALVGLTTTFLLF